MRESVERSFQGYGRPLDMVTLFKYLGRVLTAADDNWTALVGDLWKARNSWARLARILGREDPSIWISRMLFKAVVHVDVVNFFSSKIRSRLIYTQL